MIRNVLVSNVASYGSIPENLGPLGVINYIYGANGCGKTTISNILRTPEAYNECLIEWTSERKKVLVYNRDFVRDNFAQSESIKGVFTLGTENVEIRESIKIENKKIKNNSEKLNNDNEILEKSKNKLDSAEAILKDALWNIRRKYDEKIKDALQGFRGSKDLYFNKIMNQIDNAEKLLEIEELENKCTTFFRSKPEKIEILEFLVNSSDEIEGKEIFKQSIVGKNNVDISNLINYLNNSDWVLKGKEYLKTSNDNCPFCQQKVSEKFKNDIEDFFDKTFDDKINELSGVKESYLLYGSHVFSTLEKYLGHKENYYISMEKLSALGNEFKEIFNYNIDLIDNKISEPTIIIKLKSTHSTVEKINSTIKNCNDAVENYNLTIDNIQPLRDMITKQCWRYLYEKSKDLIDVNIKQTQIDRSIIIKLDAKINNIKKFINESKIKISNLEGSIKSIVPTKEFINDMLSNFGFTNFKLTESEESGFYKIIRDDGHHVANTLSEGEKTFITFLYFLGMVQGAVGEGFITEDKVVVIDDPISSLDSNVLFIVSTLIRNIINKVRGNESDVKQILLLTHNIYFHKEVTYNGGKELKDNETFWIVRKDKNKNSIVKNYKDNPIKTSYQLLWNEVKQENISVSSLQNVMRRILENYFKMFGNIDINNLADKFEGDDKFLCRSLISWVHDGSHSLQDDLFIDSGEIARESYSVIFKNIFYSNGHQAHYDMMMRLNGHIHDA